ncbi:MAG TPA: riboflavin synthase [Phycisphaerales bacterium]|nr:riboflavin synthase [Phycisphaerales bacterium]|tara:strand:+ start:51925 stop:52578 length:654 start_codon:yes stop_codon:yes gene_type:complete
MFTGLIETIGRIHGIASTPGGKRLVVDVANWTPRNSNFEHGDSICVSGVCLTMTDQQGTLLSFDVINETLDRSRLGTLAVGDQVNLESSLTANTAMGGHIVQGHVDGMGRVVKVTSTPHEFRVTVAPPTELMDAIVPKGSVCIDGVSLTIASLTDSTFDVALIPTTLSLTTLKDAASGQMVNLETDIVAKTILHWLTRNGSKASGVTMEKLLDAGFM